MEPLHSIQKVPPEGEWTCSKCGSDYCAADGKEKMPGSKIFLIPYSGANNTQQSGTTVDVHAQDVMPEDMKANLINEINYSNFVRISDYLIK